MHMPCCVLVYILLAFHCALHVLPLNAIVVPWCTACTQMVEDALRNPQPSHTIMAHLLSMTDPNTGESHVHPCNSHQSYPAYILISRSAAIVPLSSCAYGYCPAPCNVTAVFLGNFDLHACSPMDIRYARLSI